MDEPDRMPTTLARLISELPRSTDSRAASPPPPGPMTPLAPSSTPFRAADDSSVGAGPTPVVEVRAPGVGEVKQDAATDVFDESTLSKLPLPTLAATADRYISTVSPLLSQAELEATKGLMRELCEPGGVGEKLQAALEARRAEKDNWFEQYWYDAYLTGRSALPCNSNPFFVLEDDPTPHRNSQAARATSLIVSTLNFYYAIRTGTLKPDDFKDHTLSMLQYKYLFHATRIPGEVRDETVTFPRSTHIVVLCRGQVFWFDVISADGTCVLSKDAISTNLRTIREEAFKSHPGNNARNAVGVLTTENRTTWAHARRRLIHAHEDNAVSIRKIDSALFVVCLDDVELSTLNEQSTNFLHVGTCLNRWFDKSLQIIVCRNGAAGLNFEHSMLDGHTVLRYASDVFTDTMLRFASSIRSEVRLFMDGLKAVPAGSGRIDASVKRIVWQLTADLELDIHRAEARFSDSLAQTEVCTLEFSNFGKDYIVSASLSPDGLVQASLQMAYYRLYGEHVNTYETVMTKHYRHGRTEAARPLTNESKALARIFSSRVSGDAKLEALRAAITRQSAIVNDCLSGKGVDRHMYALYCVAQELGLPVPAIFSDVSWQRVGRNVLSTSNCGNPSLRLFGFGPVVQDGFGIGYIIKRDGIQFCVSSKRRQTQRFVSALASCLLDVQTLLENERHMTSTPVAGSVALRATPGLTYTGYGSMNEDGAVRLA